MATLEPRVFVQGSTDTFTMTVSADTTLNAQVVSFSFDLGATWKVASWIGTSGKKRQASLTVSAANLPTFPFGPRMALVKLDNTILIGQTRLVQGVVPS